MAAPSSFRMPILYKVACEDKEARRYIDRYSEEPFVDEEAEKEERETLALMDVIEVVEGTFPPGKRRRDNQSRINFGSSRLEDDDYPFVLGKDFIVRNSIFPKVRIFSKAVNKLLKDELQYYPGLSIPESEFIISYPYAPLVFCYKKFQEISEKDNGDEAAAIEESFTPPTESSTSSDGASTPTNDTSSANWDKDSFGVGKSLASHIKVVMGWFQPQYNKEIGPELETHSRGMANFKKLWLLFKPGAIVFARSGGFYRILLVEKKYPKDKERAFHTWDISAWSLDFDGHRLRRRAKEFQIQEFLGEAPILQLPIIPVGYMKPEQGNLQNFIDRGKLYCMLICQGPALQHYRGPLSGRKALQYSGAVVVDPLKSTERMTEPSGLGTITIPEEEKDSTEFKEPGDLGGGPLYSKYNSIPVKDKIIFDDEEMYLLCPGKIWGFALGKKQWAEFNIRNFASEQISFKASSNLVIDAGDLDLIRSLGKASDLSFKGYQNTDFVDGKGVSRCVLLHGPPGVGKSFTVECLAQDLEMPLISLTVADIGTDQSTIEQKLAGWLDLAQRWGALMLIDEADIYLAKRKQDELARNALVTVFLRSLEYYPGMIFLTTNQPGYIDDAFNSRFHLIIEYPQMTESKRTAIWEKFLDKVDLEQEDLERSDVRIKIKANVRTYVTSSDEVKALELNGRDIRNAFQAAIRMAIYRTEKDNIDKKFNVVDVTVEDFQKVVRNKSAYKKYLDGVHGRSEENRALDDSARRAGKGEGKVYT